MSSTSLASLAERLPLCMNFDRDRLARRLAGLQRRLDEGKPIDRGLAEMAQAIDASAAHADMRRSRAPRPSFPEELPVCAKRAEIAEAIAKHQVVVVAGETGSGKTTQIPKICLELGRGITGMIGHTQPRRIAARSVATRIAEELQTPLGQTVGFKVRFSDHVSEQTMVKLLTDGMLLAEVQGDPLLSQYDTIIIDEAHERSLNIDFLLGYFKQLLPKRPDLKLIVTSATINTESFSQFFGGAPIIEVSGRTYPVEVRYRPLAGDEEERDRSQVEAIIDAVAEVTAIDPRGDILIFLAGEREIRESAEALRKHSLKHTEILPLYSRLTAQEQDRVFKPHAGRRIVLSTNVAETSLTVPGIRFVIDPGFVRLSRYSHRTKVQRLPIETVSQASANQRAGRCGRVGPGVCIRLYAEEDFLNRPRFTEPEVLRTNLASVILQMASLRLGDPEAFPFMEPPDRRYVSDGYRALQELGAVDDLRDITEIGRKLARLPIDPRLGRMLLAAEREGCVAEMLTIASALSVQDPRERPMEAQQKADQCHSRFQDERSDFIAYLKLWDYYRDRAKHLSQNKLRKLCKEEFLSYVRLREWHEIHGQLAGIAEELGFHTHRSTQAPLAVLPEGEEKAEAGDAPDYNYDPIHRAILTGFLSHVAVKDEPEPGDKKPGEKRRRDTNEYLGARNLKLTLFPGSGLVKKSPKWIVAAELVETARLFARTAAAIKPEWIEQLAPHLLKRHWFEPHWEKKPAQVAAAEQATLYGLIIVPRRRVNYGPIDPVTSRDIFIREGLVAGELRTDAPFFNHNRKLIAEIEELEAKSRRRDVLVDEHYLYDFYAARLPADVYDGHTLDRWRRAHEKQDPKALFLSREELMRHGAEGVTGDDYPATLMLDGVALALSYHFEPGHPADGVTATIPVSALGQIRGGAFDWLVPGVLEEKVIALIKSLPKQLRKNFVPAPNFAQAVLARIKPSSTPLAEAVAAELKKMTGVPLSAADFQLDLLPPHLHMNFRVVDDKGKELESNRDFAQLQAGLATKAKAAFQAQPFTAIERTGILTWDFEPLEEVTLERNGLSLRAYPGLVDAGESVTLRLFQQPEEAESATAAGLRRLFMLTLPDKVKYLKRSLPGLQTMCLHYATLGQCDDLKEDLTRAAFDAVFMQKPWPRSGGEFEQRIEERKGSLIADATALAAKVAEALAEHHAIAKQLSGNVPPHRLPVASDLRAQLSYLIRPGFIAATPREWLPHLPRYLKAARLRLEKYDRAPERDRQAALDVERLWAPVRTLIDAGKQLTPEQVEFRWHLEELRVSLFAQELKAIVPVSVQRLEKRWREISR